MKKFMCKIIAASSTIILAISSIIPSSIVSADAIPVVTVGADLSEEQRNKIFEFFGVNPSETMIIEINNAQERQYLEGLISDDIIGTRTISCSYIMPTSAGGLVVKTANLTYVDENMIANALLTAGVENCQVLATAPFKVSGTGALTGILCSYEKSSGETLDEEKKAAATEELIITGEIIDEVISNTEEKDSPQDNKKDEENLTEEYIFKFLNELKTEALNGNLNEDTAKELLDKNLDEYKIELTEQTYNKLLEYIKSFSKLDYKGKFEEKLSSLTDRISEGFNINFNPQINININIDESLNAFEKFWETLKNWLKYIFNSGEMNININTDGIKDKVSNIFDNVNTDIIGYDVEPEEEPVQADEVEENTDVNE